MKKYWKSVAAVAALSLATGMASPATAQETFQVISVNTLGCDSGNFGMTVERANLDGGTYYVHTVATVGGLIYMNEAASISVNGLSAWNLFSNLTYGPVPIPGTWPIPPDQTVQIDFYLERPLYGTVLYTWQLIVDGCNTGNILFNGVPQQSVLEIPTLSPWGIAGFAALILMAAAFVLRMRGRRPTA